MKKDNRSFVTLTRMLASLLVCALMLPLAACTTSAEAATFESAQASSYAATTVLLPEVDSGIDSTKKAEVESKDEVIYGLLAYDGSVEEAYAINRFRVNTEGTFVDYGAYRAVENLTNTERITTAGDEVTLTAAAGDFYYQGTMEDAALPWQLSFAYTLDDKELSAEDVASLGGKSGRLGIHIATKATPEVDPRFYEHYTLQITVSLPSENIENLVAEGATIAAAGSNTQVSYVVLPQSDGSFDLAVDFDSINMPGISVAAVPYGTEFDFPDTSELSSELTTLVNAINQLYAGTQQVSSGTYQAAAGLEQLASGSALFNSGLLSVNEGSGGISSNSSMLSSNLAATVSGLEQLAPLIENSTDIPPEQKAQILGSIAGLRGLADGYTQLDAGIQGYTAGVSSLAAEYAQINGGLSASAAGLWQLNNGVAELNSGVGSLSGNIQTMPEEMQAQIDEFAASYDFSGFEPASFISSKNTHVALVQFVLTTPAIELPEETQVTEEVVSESSILDRIVALFTGE